MTDFLSIDQAVASLNEPQRINTNNEEVSASNAADDLSDFMDADPDLHPTENEDAALEPSGDVESENDDGEDESLAPPEFWDASGKEEFAKLDREAQQLILNHDKKASVAVSKALNDAALQRKAADSEIAKFTENRSKLEDYLGKAIPDHSKKWDNIDWPTWYNTDFQAATIGKANMERETAHLQQLKAVKEQTDQIAHKSHVEREAHKLIALAQSDPATKRIVENSPAGNDARLATANYLLQRGVRQEQLSWIAAEEMAIAHKAMLYDQLQEKAKSKGNQKVQPQAQTSGTKIRASTSPSTPASQNNITKQKQRLGQTGSVDDAVALMLMQKNNRR